MDKPYIHTYCVMRIGQLGLSQTALAALCHCSVPTLNMILRGKRTSAKIENKVAKTLGHKSWFELTKTAEEFSLAIKKIDTRLKSSEAYQDLNKQRRSV